MQTLLVEHGHAELAVEMWKECRKRSDEDCVNNICVKRTKTIPAHVYDLMATVASFADSEHSPFTSSSIDKLVVTMTEHEHHCALAELPAHIDPLTIVKLVAGACRVLLERKPLNNESN